MIPKPAINKPILLLALLGLMAFLYQVPYLFSGKAGDDFRIYYDAAVRFHGSKLALYDMASRGFDQYLYPPPCILLFSLLTLLPLKAAYYLFIAVIFSCFFIAMDVWRKIVDVEAFAKTSRLNNILLNVFLASSAMVIHNLVMGQVNVLVLLLCVLFVRLSSRQPFTAGAMLALAVWLKLYPVVMVFWAAGARDGRKSIVWGIISGIAIALLLLPVLPIGLYADFLHKLKEISSYTSAHIINQSLSAFLYRMNAGYEQFFNWPNVYFIPFWIKVTNLVAVVLSILFFAKAGMGKMTNEVRSAFFMVLIPVFSTLGWGHSFIFVAPLLFLCYRQCLISGTAPRRFKAILSATACLFLIPVHNTPVFLQRLPLFVQNFYYSRFLLLSLCFLIALVFCSRESAGLKSGSLTQN